MELKKALKVGRESDIEISNIWKIQGGIYEIQENNLSGGRGSLLYIPAIYKITTTTLAAL